VSAFESSFHHHRRRESKRVKRRNEKACLWSRLRRTVAMLVPEGSSRPHPAKQHIEDRSKPDIDRSAWQVHQNATKKMPARHNRSTVMMRPSRPFISSFIYCTILSMPLSCRANVGPGTCKNKGEKDSVGGCWSTLSSLTQRFTIHSCTIIKCTKRFITPQYRHYRVGRWLRIHHHI
jgi:hypothetical protein